jgi:hypothetical protein
VRRLFWLAVGAGVAVVAARRANKLARAVTPAGVADRLAGLAEQARDFADEVRAGMTERELELRDALGLDDAALDDEAPDDRVRGDGLPGDEVPETASGRRRAGGRTGTTKGVY